MRERVKMNCKVFEIVKVIWINLTMNGIKGETFISPAPCHLHHQLRH